jgi:hypothetical protein
MAISLHHIECVITFVDTGGNKCNRSIRIDAESYADCTVVMNSFLAALADVSDALILSAKLSSVYLEGTPSLPASAEIEKGALLLLPDLDDGVYKMHHWTIPAPKDAIFVAASGEGYNQVDTSDAAVLALIAMFEEDVYLSDGEHTDGTIYGGHRVTRASSNG